MKIGILCNGKVSLPGIQQLYQMGNQLALAIPEKQMDDHYHLESFAMACQIPIIRVQKKMLTEQLINWSLTFSFDCVFVITFPHILSSKLLEGLKVPIFNFHFAPLPQYQGAQPVFWMLKNGEEKGGISVHELTKEVDAGPLLHFEPYSISEIETFGSYMLSTSHLNARVVVEVVRKLSSSNWKKKLKAQDKSQAKYWPKPDFSAVQINWNKMSATEVERLCRACNPWNKGAVTSLNGMMLKLVEVEVCKNPKHQGEKAGELVDSAEDKALLVSTLDGYLKINIMYLEEEGFIGNKNLKRMGFKGGMTFSS